MRDEIDEKYLKTDEVDLDRLSKMNIEDADLSVENVYQLLFREGKSIVAPKKRFVVSKLKGERKKENWLLLEKAYMADPIVFRAINIIADLTVSYGFYFDYPYTNADLNKREEEFVTKLTEWSEYVDLSSVIRNALVDLVIFGNAFIEKVYNDDWGISNLKIIHPATMFVDRDDDGTVKAYYQRPSGFDTNTYSSLVPFISMERDIKLYPENVIHLKWNNPTNATYGTSGLLTLIDSINIKLGMKEDMSYLVQRWAEPFVAWLVGNEKFSNVSVPMINKVRNIINKQSEDKNMALPWYVEPKPIAVGNETMDVSTYLAFMNDEIIKGLGVPDVILGSGGSGGRQASAEVKFEAFVRFLRSLQIYVSNIFRRYCFTDIVIPLDTDKGSGDVGSFRATSNLEISYKDWKKIPSLRWRPIESIADQRLRIDALTKAGVLDLEKARKELNLRPTANEKQFSPENRERLANEALRLSQAKMSEEQRKNPKKFQSSPAQSAGGASSAAKPKAKPKGDTSAKKK